MREINLEERKKILSELLKYVDKICRENSIHYSLFGGSLIGGIRHKGIIPWDDDVDIILLPDEHRKLINILEKQGGKYLLLDPETSRSYPYPFTKLVDTRTVVFENGIKKIDDYGVYIDIFTYHYVSNIKFFRTLHYRNLVITKKMFGLSLMSFFDLKKKHAYKKMFILPLAKMISTRRLKKVYMNICDKNKKTNYILSNWPAYGKDKEIQLAKAFNGFQDCDFENNKAMICDGYDSILSTTFGNYMELPPVEKRKSNHGDKAFWK